MSLDIEKPRWKTARRWLDAFSQAIPLIAVASLLASMLYGGSWSSMPSLSAAPALGQPLSLESPGHGPARAQIETGRSEAPFEFSFSAAVAGSIFLDSRHVVTLSCRSQSPDGSWTEVGHVAAQGYLGSGGLARFDQGYKMEAKPGQRFSCSQTSTGPAKIRAWSMTPREVAASAQSFESNVEAMKVAFGLMIMFSLINSVINKNRSYVLFAIFLILNYRLAQMGNGNDMDFGWISFDKLSMPRIRMITMSMVLMSATMLNEVLLSHFYGKLPKALALWSRGTWWLTVALFGLGTLLSYHAYIPTMWLCTIDVGLMLLAKSFWLGKQRRSIGWAPMLTSLGVSLTVIFAFSEVAAAALGVSKILDYANHQTGAIFQSWVAALAFAFQLREKAKCAQSAQEMLNESYQATPMGLFLAQEDGVVLQSNPALTTRMQEDASSGWSMADHFAGQWPSFLSKVKASPSGLDMEIEVRSKNGEPQWFDVRAKIDDQGRVEGALQDATEKVLHRNRLEFLASHDPLTECLNLRGLEKLLDQINQRGSGAAVAAYLDLDRFKLVNDVYGHEAGDQVLREVKQRLIGRIGAHGQLCRVGGDEFLIFFENVGLDRAQEICEAALGALQGEPYVFGDKSFRISASAGIVEAKAIGASNARSLIGAADSACRMAKAKGQGILVAYGRDSMFFDRRQESFEIAKLLSQPQLPRGLYLLAQPIMSLTTPFDSLNFELLMRMRMEDGREVGAGPLIETAEAHGTIGRLDYWMLETAIAWIQKHADQLTLTRFICVNLSGGSLNDEAFLQKAFALFERNKAASQFLCVEVTESVALRDLDNTCKFVEKCREIGLKVALDDFGAGYSSFGYLKELPADALKIDGALVKDAMVNEATQSILIALSGLSKALGMRTIAEWAETCQMVKMLSMAGFDYVQGYAVSKPMPMDEIIKFKSCADVIADPETSAFARHLQQGAPNPFLDDAPDSQWLH